MKKNKIKIKIMGRAGLKYSSDDRIMLIDSEMLTGSDFDMVVYKNSISRWCPPHENESLSIADKEQIMSNITKKLKHIKIDWQ